MRDGKYVILQVDDDRDLCESTRLVLESQGYLFEEAHTAEAGLKAFKQHQPDFIIVDLMMEEIDAGMNLIKELRLAGNEAPVFLLSAAGDQLSRQTDARRMGFTGVLQKPVDPQLLIQTISDLLSSQ